MVLAVFYCLYAGMNTVTLLYYVEGSWDYTIRVWDTRDGTCLDTVYDHGADVYGKTDPTALQVP